MFGRITQTETNTVQFTHPTDLAVDRMTRGISLPKKFDSTSEGSRRRYRNSIGCYNVSWYPVHDRGKVVVNCSCSFLIFVVVVVGFMFQLASQTSMLIQPPFCKIQITVVLLAN